MNRTTYTPITGSTADRVIKHLMRFPPGTRLTSAQLIEALDLQTGDISGFLAAAVKYDLLRKATRPGTRLMDYWIGRGEPAEPLDRKTEFAALAAESAALKKPKAAPAVAPKPTLEEHFPTPSRVAARAFIHMPEDAQQVTQAQAPAPAPFSCALWSDGRLQMVVKGQPITLAVDETQALVHYLDRLTIEA